VKGWCQRGEKRIQYIQVNKEEEKEKKKARLESTALKRIK